MFPCPLWAGLAVFVEVASARGLTADDAARSALSHDPVYLSALAAEAQARGELRATALLRDNPTISAELSVARPRWSAAVSQPLSLTGEGLARHEAARAAADAAELERARAALVCAAEARGAWVDVRAAEDRRALAAEALDEAHTRRVAVEARVRAGEAAELDARLARLAEASAALALVDAERAAAAARVALARFVPDAATVELEGAPASAAPPPRGAAARADLLAAARRVDAAEATLRAERAASLPPLTLGAAFEQEGTARFAGPTLELGLPLWTRNPDGRATASAAAERARAEAAAQARAVEAEQLGAAGAAARSRLARAALVGDPGGDARAALDTLDRAEAQGELDRATATLLRQEVLEGALAAISLEQASAHAELDALLAASDPALLPPEPREAGR